MSAPDLAQFDNSWYHPGRGPVLRGLWFFLGLPLLRCSLIPFSCVRRSLLRLFGAALGRGVVLKPGLRVKYPWLLSVGDNSWLGEDCWIDNLALVTIGNNVCVSQGAYLCTGNHDWSDPAFPLTVKPITLADGSWVGARTVVCPGVTLNECAVAAAGSVVTKDIPPYEIHAGNPARFVRRREIHARAGAGRPVEVK
jgi:putative colanic acid biosynthesis acetyltransferase WcaF